MKLKRFFKVTITNFGKRQTKHTYFEERFLQLPLDEVLHPGHENKKKREKITKHA